MEDMEHLETSRIIVVEVTFGLIESVKMTVKLENSVIWSLNRGLN